MYTVYQIVFYTGILYTVVSFLLGELFHFVDLHVDTHFDGNIHFLTISPLKPSTIAAFATTFGGVGIIGTKLNKGAAFTLIIALVLALLVAALIYFLVIVPLYKAQNTAIAEHEKLKGVSAVVISPILQDGFGEITYTVNDNTFTAPAKHVGKAYIGAGEEVYIAYIEDNVFYVDSISNKSIRREDKSS
jgi:membrane protein implicated in regulation of membrane protease activity